MVVSKILSQVSSYLMGPPAAQLRPKGPSWMHQAPCPDPTLRELAEPAGSPDPQADIPWLTFDL